MPATLTNKIYTPWGASASSTYLQIPGIPSQIGPTTPGVPSYTDGFVPLNFKDPATQGGKAIKGEYLNGLFNVITTYLAQFQQGLYPGWDTSIAATTGYGVGAKVEKADGSGTWRNTVAANNTNPDASGAGWVSGGSVTSVGLVDGSTTAIYTVSGSPVTGAGSLTFTLNSQAVSTVLAGPTSGASAQPSFRVLGMSDITGLVAALGSLSGGLVYAGNWNASTNTPTLVSSSGVAGHIYIVTNAGTTNLNGNASWSVGDKAVFNGLTSAWDKWDGLVSEVLSVSGRTGAVTLSTSDISGLAAVASSGSASSLTTGTLPLAQLPTAIPNANLATMVANTFKGNITGSAAVPTDLTVAQMVAALNVPPSADVQTLTASGTWTKPTTGTPIITRVILIPAGAGGGSGAVGASVNLPGGGGGGGGSPQDVTFLTSTLPATVAVTLGAAGAGGAAGSSAGGNGNRGTDANGSQFGSLVFASGGGAGNGGIVNITAAQGGFGGSSSLFYYSSNLTGGTGTTTAVLQAIGNDGAGGGGSNNGVANQSTGMAGGFSFTGGAGGGAGGGFASGTTTFTAASAGAAGGAPACGYAAPGTGGSSNGANGGNGHNTAYIGVGSAGGGGAAGAGVAGGTGGTAGYGSGGGGGGAAQTGFASGAGGSGGAPLFIAITTFA